MLVARSNFTAQWLKNEHELALNQKITQGGIEARQISPE
jgi:hypothetical protein